MPHVLYAEPSTGKTSAFVEKVMVDNEAPALMVSGQAFDHDSFVEVDTLLVSKSKDRVGYQSHCGIAALQPKKHSERALAVLILDEFNYEGPDRININIVEILFRQIYTTTNEGRTYFEGY